MRSRMVIGATLAAALMSVAPATALQQVILPQSGNDATNTQPTDSANQNPFSADQSENKTNSLGTFHFNVTSGSDWPGDPYRTYRPQTSTPDAYGSAATPGSEFSNSYLFPH